MNIIWCEQKKNIFLKQKMAASRKRTKSFKYCSKRRKAGCSRAKKTCSYKASRTPKCQPRKYKAKKSTKKKSKRSKKSTRNTLSMAKKRVKGQPMQKKSEKYSFCSKRKSKKSCKTPKTGSDDMKNACSWARGTCRVKKDQQHILDKFVTVKELKLSYPITQEGLLGGMFVLSCKKDSSGNQIVHLYLRYGTELLETMTKDARDKCRYWYYKKGEALIEQRKKKIGTADNLYLRFGDGLKLSATDIEVVSNIIKTCARVPAAAQVPAARVPAAAQVPAAEAQVPAAEAQVPAAQVPAAQVPASDKSYYYGFDAECNSPQQRFGTALNGSDWNKFKPMCESQENCVYLKKDDAKRTNPSKEKAGCYNKSVMNSMPAARRSKRGAEPDDDDD